MSLPGHALDQVLAAAMAQTSGGEPEAHDAGVAPSNSLLAHQVTDTSTSTGALAEYLLDIERAAGNQSVLRLLAGQGMVQSSAAARTHAASLVSKTVSNAATSLSEQLTYVGRAQLAYYKRSTELAVDSFIGIVTVPIQYFRELRAKGPSTIWTRDQIKSYTDEWLAGIAAPWKKLREGVRTNDPELTGEAMADVSWQIMGIVAAMETGRQMVLSAGPHLPTGTPTAPRRHGGPSKHTPQPMPKQTLPGPSVSPLPPKAAKSAHPPQGKGGATAKSKAPDGPHATKGKEGVSPPKLEKPKATSMHAQTKTTPKPDEPKTAKPVDRDALTTDRAPAPPHDSDPVGAADAPAPAPTPHGSATANEPRIKSDTRQSGHPAEPAPATAHGADPPRAGTAPQKQLESRLHEITSDYDPKSEKLARQKRGTRQTVYERKKASKHPDDQAEIFAAELFQADGHRVHFNAHGADLTVDDVVLADVKHLHGDTFTSAVTGGAKQAAVVIVDGTTVKLTRAQTEWMLKDLETEMAGPHSGKYHRLEKIYIIEGTRESPTVYIRNLKGAPLKAPNPERSHGRSTGKTAEGNPTD